MLIKSLIYMVFAFKKEPRRRGQVGLQTHPGRKAMVCGGSGTLCRKAGDSQGLDAAGSARRVIKLSVVSLHSSRRCPSVPLRQHAKSLGWL